MGDPSATSGRGRNLIWRTFTGKSTRVRKSDAEVDDFETNAVADLRRAVGTYPDDPELANSSTSYDGPVGDSPRCGRSGRSIPPARTPRRSTIQR
jgi:hypothetical protein